MALLVLFLACTDPGADPAGPAMDSGDSGAPAVAGWYGRADLEPAFAHHNAIWAGAALLDFDGDGWLDVFLTNGNAHPDALYRNNGDGSFTDVAAAAGVDSRLENGSAVAGDLDNDGDTDLVVAGSCSTGTLDPDGFSLQDGHKLVYDNQGDGTFVQRELPELPNDAWTACTYSLTLSDIDSDGFLDLLVSNGIDVDLAPPWVFQKQNGAADDVLLVNDGTGSFDQAVFYGDTYGTFATVVVDLDGDAVPEVVGGAAGRDLQVRAITPDGLQATPEQHLTGAGLWMGLAPADFDGDGDLDLYSTNMGLSPFLAGYDNVQGVEHDTGLYIFHALLENVGGDLQVATDWPLDADQLLPGDLFDGYQDRYPEWVDPDGLARQGWGWGAAALDADADGWPDVAWVGNNCAAPMEIIWEEAKGASPGALLRNVEGTGFQDITSESGIANVDDQGRYVDGRGVAVGDLDLDGHADLVITNKSYNPSQSDPLAQESGFATIWLSSRGSIDRGGWLQVDPVGATSNRDGIGAEVRVELADGRVLTQVVGAGGGTNSAHEPLAILGLGDSSPESVIVRFPSGSQVELLDVSPDQRLVVEEPSTEEPALP